MMFFKNKKFLCVAVQCLIFCVLQGCAPQSRPWLGGLRHELGYLGARNWVVIAEASFPIQNGRGLRVLQLDADIPDVLEGLEDIMEEKYHVQPRLYIAEELAHVPYDYAPGVKSYKKELEEALHGRATVRLDNKMLMHLLSETNKSYRVLVIKTRTALPYSSIFIELKSGYWDAESEIALRQNMKKKM